MFLRNWWYCAAESGEVGRSPLGCIFLDEPVVLYRRVDGTPVALEDQCCHRRAPLRLGALEGDHIRCGYHGFLYDSTGACIWVPGQSSVPPEARVRAYPVCERHGWVWIWMGEASRADEARVPDFFQNEHPEWASVCGVLRFKANHMLLVDNLLDLSHLAFLHASSIGSQRDTNPDLTWERGEDWVRGTRVSRNVAASQRMRDEGVTAGVDQTKIMTFTPPANVLIEITTTETGLAPGETGRLHQYSVIIDAITPETETSCHYFWANARNYDIEDADHSAAYLRVSEAAFAEDMGMLEGQQHNIERDPDKAMVDVNGDSGGLQARRLVERLLLEDSQARAAAE